MTKGLPGCYYLSLPVNHYGAADYPKFDEMVEVGYQFAKAWFREMEASNQFPNLAIPKPSQKSI
jgi:hypothetical protein